MSSLLKQALKEFAIDDINNSDDSDTEKFSSKSKPAKVIKVKTSIAETNKYGIVKKKKKELKKLHRKRELALKQTQLNSNSEALLQKHRKRNYLQDNLACLKLLEASIPESLQKQTDKARSIQRKRIGAETRSVKSADKQNAIRSIFSEKDFREFEGELQDLFTS